MNKMILSEFSPWLIRNLLSRMYNRHRNFNPQIIKSKVGAKTWIDCYYKERIKLLYREQAIQYKKSQWQSSILYQINKLNKRHDVAYLWGICEFYNLEKMNNLKFISNTNHLWQFVAIEQSAKINKIRTWEKSLRRTEKYSWGDLISHTNYKFNKKKKADSPWAINLRANNDKFNKVFWGDTWENCIYQNIRKINKW